MQVWCLEHLLHSTLTGEMYVLPFDLFDEREYISKDNSCVILLFIYPLVMPVSASTLKNSV